MSYKVLYRKYRPINFKEVIGQDNIITILKNSIVQKNFSHAYIFTGPRGTGKTSTAKILAKTINCENPINGEACNECQSCLNFNSSPDIIEIDAASNNGVDEIRELRNNVTLAPSNSKYKIYIIDEVHMLTTGAFNALLKTLEEPPEHAIFILATTEIYKVPITILSRCQRYDFKKIEKIEMLKHLEMVCEKEKIKFDKSSLEEIYWLSEGCARDALSILDQISKMTREVNSTIIRENYEMITKEDIILLLDSIKTKKTSQIINTINRIENSGINPQKLIKMFIKYLEDIAIDIKLQKEIKYSFNMIKKIIENLNQIYIDARINDNTYTLIKLCFLENIDEEFQIKKKKDIIAKESIKMDLVDIRINNCFCKANKNDLNDCKEKWGKIEEKNIKFKNIRNFVPVAASEDNIIITIEDESLADLFNIKFEELENDFKKENIDQKIVALSNNRWNTEKTKYILNIKNKMVYEYIEEPKKKDDSSNLKKQVDELFSEKKVEIS